jgi:large subunit ribosomal protein L6
MKKEIIKKIEIPEGIEVKIDEGKISVKGKEGENSREFNINNMYFEKKGNELILGSKKATKVDKKIINSILAHIQNMIEGVQKKFEYQLKICFNHFPITVELSGNNVTIKNFLGEKIPRTTKIIEGCDVKLNKEIITVTSLNKESAGQTAANFEMATKIRNRDRRVFQDGIFIINKAGKEI